MQPRKTAPRYKLVKVSKYTGEYINQNSVNVYLVITWGISPDPELVGYIFDGSEIRDSGHVTLISACPATMGRT